MTAREHLSPVPASRVVTGPVDLTFRVDRRERSWMVTATVAAVIAVSTLITGLVVIL